MAANSVSSARNYLTIAFSDLSRSTAIAEALEPETYAELLGHLRDLFETIVPRHGGEIIRIDGDGVLSIFGHPGSDEDAGRRAVEAAIDLHSAAAALDGAFAPPGLQIRLHTGIHSGIVLLRSGDLLRGRYEVIGDATNLAARLCDAAPADTIIASEEALGADRTFFLTGERRGIDFAGRHGELFVYEVLGREPAATRFVARERRGIAAFLGRQAELSKLETWRTTLPADAPRTVAIVAPAGMGKTRLASEFLRRAHDSGCPVYRGYCESYLGALPLQPFIQIARAMVADGHAPAPEHADNLHRLLAADSAGEGRALPGIDDAVDAMCSLIAAVPAAPGAALLLFVDDWQWSDDASRRMLAALQVLLRRPLLIILAARGRDLLEDAAADAFILDVPPLSDDEAERAIRAMIDSSEPFVALRLRDYAGGSPLFIEELCHALRAGHELPAEADRSSWLDRLIQARFTRLPADKADLVRIAAVIGHVVPSALFEALTGLGPDAPVLRELAAADFLYPGDVDGTLRFKHGITRDAVYRAISLGERQQIHRAIVEALHAQARNSGGEEQVEALAHHYAALRDHAWALHYAQLSGTRALNASALDRAQAHFRGAVVALNALPVDDAARKATTAIAQKFGLSCVFDPSPDQLPVLEYLSRLAEQQGNRDGQLVALLWMGNVYYGTGDARPSIACLQRALEIGSQTPGNERLRAQVKANLGQSLVAVADYARAAPVLDEAIAELRALSGKGRHTGLPYALCCRAFMMADQGDFAAAAPYYAEVDTMLGDGSSPMFGSYITQASAVASWQGKYREAIHHAERGIAIAERTHSRYFMIMSRALRAHAAWRDTRDPQFIEMMIDACRWFLSGASQQRTSIIYGWLTEALADQGDAQRARFYAAQALRRARAGDHLGECAAARALARLAASGKLPKPAQHYLALADAAAAARGSFRDAALNAACAAELARHDNR